ncbi:MAG: PQQ-like beta-propeller repeat protein [Rickettsiales bacterium]|nr:PQQ-like beta-propeller repeat protein [Rickettsiales bacterium]
MSLKLGNTSLFIAAVVACSMFFPACSSDKYTSKDGEVIFSASSNIEESPSLIGVDVNIPKTVENTCLLVTDFDPENIGISMDSYPKINDSQYKSLFARDGKYDFYVHPIVCDGAIYDFTNGKIVVYKLDAKGKVKKQWSSAVFEGNEKDNIQLANARLKDGFIYTSASNGWVAKFDVAKRAVVWKKHYAGGFGASPTVHNDRVYLITATDELLALDANTGEVDWQIEEDSGTTTSLQTPPVVVYQDKVLAGFSNGIFALVGADSGDIVWKTKVINGRASGNIVNILDIDFPPVIFENEGIVVAGGIRSSVMGFDLLTGQPRWQIATGLNSYMLKNDDGFGFFVDKDNNNIVFNAINGAIKTIDRRGDVVISERVPSYLNCGKDYISQRVNRYFDVV